MISWTESERSWAANASRSLYLTILRECHRPGCACYLCSVLVLLNAVEDGDARSEHDANVILGVTGEVGRRRVGTLVPQRVPGS